MDKVYRHQEVEEKIYKTWEDNGYFVPAIDQNKKPFSIILPPPNANAPLHFGHAMYVIEDILIRYHRMRGDPTLWLPGADHAGFETQFVFEKHLASEGKSRFDYDRHTLYKMIWDFVQKNRGGMENQLRRLGFSLDWSRMKFTLDQDIVTIVHQTFKKMYDEGFIYRDYRLVNYCTRDGTSFSDLEVTHVEQKDSLYYLKYGPFVLATVRPETRFGDTAVAVNPHDKRYTDWVGKEIEVEGLLGKFTLKVIADDVIDPNFGTGVAKVTPSIDMKDFEIGKRHNLPMKLIVGFDGKLTGIAGPYAGILVKKAREKVVRDMKARGLIEKIDENYIHTVSKCYKCGTTLEPLPLEQWFIKMEPLAKLAVDAVKGGDIKIFPKRFEKIYFQFLENIKDWNISRQIVWGIRIPAWKCENCVEWTVTAGETPNNCQKCKSKKIKQDDNTFDTWFSSAQWPFVTLKASPYKGDYDYFYPTTVMETGYDILRWWVARMAMVGISATKKVPFKHVVLHGLVKDPLGKKMSKSKGNVVNPLELVDQYGADAVRMALVYGTALGNDQSLSYSKLQAMRNFTNKLWNMGRFIEMKQAPHFAPPKGGASRGKQISFEELLKIAKHKDDKEMVKKMQGLVKKITKDLDNYGFNQAAEALYDFAWHEFADQYIEDVKNRIDDNSYLMLTTLYVILLKLIHPFMPFITEAIYQRFGFGKSIMIDGWL